jgi:PHD/YefM family antitoxin component YafN of YafNO toxin-antitoxin module
MENEVKAMNTDSYQALQAWLRGRHYDIKRVDQQLVLLRDGRQVAVVTPPDHYQVAAVEMSFNEWVEFNKCIRNIRHYLAAEE